MGPVNTKISILHLYATNPNKMKDQLETHNEYIKKHVEKNTLPLLRKIKNNLASKYELTSPISETELENF